MPAPASRSRLSKRIPLQSPSTRMPLLPCTLNADGVANTTISVTAPSFNQGQGVQKVRLAFPAFSTLEYDPTSSFAATDASLDSDLSNLLASSGALPARGAAAALALALAAVAALL